MFVRRDQVASESSNPSASAVPSPRLLRAAISGLVAASGAAACDDNSSDSAKVSSQDLSNEQLTALCADMLKKTESEHADAKSQDLDVACKDKVEEAKNSCEKPDADALCKDKVASAKSECPKPDASMLCADMLKNACAPKLPEEKTTNAEQKEYTFTQLTKMCDDRGGYVQIHAACGGQNTCKGFSYGDWGPGAATLTEHSCTGVNGCAGLSCVTLPEDKRKKTGPELYDLKFGDTDPSSCSNCHADHTDEDHPDLGKFMVYVMPGSTRTTANWLDRSAAEQERIVAFGAHSTDAAGRAIQNMAPYKEVLARKDIERVVAHLRTLKPVIKTIKLVDPAPGTSPKP
jgi:hypothetical protein